MFAKGYKVSLPSAGFVILCFFLPWFLVTCGGTPIQKVSGFDMASGATIGSGVYAQQTDPISVVWLFPLAALIVIILAYFFSLRDSSLNVILDIIGILLIGFSMALWLLNIGRGDYSELAEQGIALIPQYGYWGSILGFVGIGIGGVINLIEWRKS